MVFGPTASKSNCCFTDIGGVSTQAPLSQWRATAVTSRILISGLKLVAKGWPWSPPLQSRMSSVSMRRSEEHTSELQSLMRISYAVFCLKKKKKIIVYTYTHSESYELTY